MSRDIGVQSTLFLKLVEELLPLCSKILGDFNRQVFDPCIVNTPELVKEIKMP